MNAFEIRPVELYSCFFQMPTPLKASDHTILPTYAKSSGGGIDVLNISEHNASLSGIYVSTGAMGIFLGSMSAKFGFNKYYIIVLILIISAILLYWLYLYFRL